MRFLCGMLLSLAACVLSFGIFAYLTNPRGDFAPSYFPQVVLPDRQTKLQLFQEFATHEPATGLVLGSSRSMKLKPDALNRAFGGRFFNFAVTSATVEDYGSIYSWVRRQGMSPRCLVIGLDLEALHSDDHYELALKVPELRDAFEGRSNVPVTERMARWVSTARSVFSFSYFTDSLQAIALKARPRPPAYSYNSDGYVKYERSEQERLHGAFDYTKAMTGCAKLYQARYKAMTGLSQRRCKYLEALIRRAQAEGARVIVWLTPLHPDALNEVKRGTAYPQLMAEALDYVELLRVKDHITVVDLHDPVSFGAAGTYWYDCVHYDEPAAERIVAALTTPL
jgi:hypothetical protein